MDDNKLNIITEVGVFGSLNIEDPTVSGVKKRKNDITEAELNELIQESIQNNSNIESV